MHTQDDLQSLFWTVLFSNLQTFKPATSWSTAISCVQSLAQRRYRKTFQCMMYITSVCLVHLFSLGLFYIHRIREGDWICLCGPVPITLWLPVSVWLVQHHRLHWSVPWPAQSVHYSTKGGPRSQRTEKICEWRNCQKLFGENEFYIIPTVYFIAFLQTLANVCFHVFYWRALFQAFPVSYQTTATYSSFPSHISRYPEQNISSPDHACRLFSERFVYNHFSYSLSVKLPVVFFFFNEMKLKKKKVA